MVQQAKGWLVLVEGRTLVDTPSILPLSEAEKRGTWRISCGWHYSADSVSCGVCGIFEL